MIYVALCFNFTAVLSNKRNKILYQKLDYTELYMHVCFKLITKYTLNGF